MRVADWRPVLGVELDDRSHEIARVVARDSFVGAVWADAGIPLLRVPAKAGYDASLLRRKVEELIPSTLVGIREQSGD